MSNITTLVPGENSEGMTIWGISKWVRTNREYKQNESVQIAAERMLAFPSLFT